MSAAGSGGTARPSPGPDSAAGQAPIVAPRPPRTWRTHLGTSAKWALAAVFVAYLWASFVRTDFNLYQLYAGSGRITKTLTEILSPDLSWYAYDRDGTLKLDRKTGKPKPGTVPVLLSQMNETVEISLVGTLLSVLISFPLAFAAARNLTKGSVIGTTLYWIVRLFFNVSRAFPPIILAIIFVMMVGPGPFPGVLALALHSIGMLGKMFAEAIESVDYAPIEAVKATGASSLLTVWYGILPQVVPQFVAFSLYRWDMNIRMSIILGIVGAGGIGYTFEQYIRLFEYQKASSCILVILAAVTVLDWASSYFREKLG